MKTALITGVTGQDGSYLAEFLLEKRIHEKVDFNDNHLRMGCHSSGAGV